MPDQPRISALVSTYASEEFMAECLDDLTGQSVADRLEVVVVDACSPQGEGGIVADYQKRFPRITYIRTPERIGIYAAWNVGIKAARGDYLISFSTNDRLAPDACETLSAHLDAHPEVDLVYGDTFLTDLPHQTFDGFEPSAGPEGPAWRWPAFFFPELVTRCMVGPHPMWRRRVHESVGLFDESLAALGDQDFWLRLAFAGGVLRHAARFTGLYWRQEEALSKREAARIELEALRRRHLPMVLRGEWAAPARGEAETILALLGSGEFEQAKLVYKNYFVPNLKLLALQRLGERIQALLAAGKPALALGLFRREGHFCESMAEAAELIRLMAALQAATEKS